MNKSEDSKKLKDCQFKVALRLSMCQSLGLSPLQVVQLIRWAVEEITEDFWDKNAEALQTGEAFDAYQTPLVNKKNGMPLLISCTPWPHGVLMIYAEENKSTYPCKNMKWHDDVMWLSYPEIDKESPPSDDAFTMKAGQEFSLKDGHRRTRGNN